MSDHDLCVEERVIFKSASPSDQGPLICSYQRHPSCLTWPARRNPRARCTGHATLLIQRFQPARHYGPANGHRKPRLLLDPIERYPVLLPQLQVGCITIAGIPQANRILKRRNTYTRAPQQTVQRGERLHLTFGISIELPAFPTPDLVRAWARFLGVLLRQRAKLGPLCWQHGIGMKHNPANVLYMGPDLRLALDMNRKSHPGW